jgi:cytoskeletal protein CcmA (bactofilin family)
MLRAPTMPGASPAPTRTEADVRQLIVGREITLQGEIKTCDVLIVEGSVEANISGCREINVAESGLFRGSASVDDVEIRGRFEGTLTVHKRLFVRSTGSVSGTIRYGQLEIELGGRISGDIQSQVADTPIGLATPEPMRERMPQGVIELGPTRVG